MKTLNKRTNGVYSLLYHCITCTKYRRKVFINDIVINRLKKLIIQISNVSLDTLIKYDEEQRQE